MDRLYTLDHEHRLFREIFIENFELNLQGWKTGRGFPIRVRKAQGSEKYWACSWVIVTAGVTGTEAMRGSGEMWADR